MLGTKHTVEAVTRELIEGLEDGSVVLHDEELEPVPRPDLTNLRWVPAAAGGSASAQPRASLVLVILGTALGLLGFLAAWWLFRWP
jgi:hypothetical protein